MAVCWYGIPPGLRTPDRTADPRPRRAGEAARWLPHPPMARASGARVPPPIVDPNVVSTPLVVVPSGCPTTPAPVAVFVGTLAAADRRRHGSQCSRSAPAASTVMPSTRSSMCVSTTMSASCNPGSSTSSARSPDPSRRCLHSKVRLAAPLFGGDAVIGVDDSDVHCPLVEDGMKTLAGRRHRGRHRCPRAVEDRQASRWRRRSSSRWRRRHVLVVSWRR